LSSITTTSAATHDLAAPEELCKTVADEVDAKAASDLQHNAMIAFQNMHESLLKTNSAI